MNFFYVINEKKVKKYLIIFVAVLFHHRYRLYREKQHFCISYDEPAAIYSVQTDNKVIALTFDISWEKFAEPILKILAEKALKKLPSSYPLLGAKAI